jgi:transposase, IS5 family
MGHLGCFDLSRRHECLDAKNDPRVAIAALVAWECFWPKPGAALINGELRASAAAGKSPAARKPSGDVAIFKARLRRALYTLPDDQAEYQLRGRLAFIRFLGRGIEDAVPGAKTLWPRPCGQDLVALSRCAGDGRRGGRTG